MSLPLTKSDIVRYIRDVNNFSDKLINKKGIIDSKICTTSDVVDKIKLLSPPFNFYYNETTPPEDTNKIWIKHNTPDEITLNSNNLPHNCDSININCGKLYGETTFYKNYILWLGSEPFTSENIVSYLNSYDIATGITKQLNLYATYGNRIQRMKIFVYNNKILLVPYNNNREGINSILEVDLYTLSSTKQIKLIGDTTLFYPPRLINNRLYVCTTSRQTSTYQGYNCYNIDSGILEPKFYPYREFTNLPNDLCTYKGRLYHTELENTSSSAKTLYIYEYDIKTFNKSIVHWRYIRTSGNIHIVHQTIINHILYVFWRFDDGGTSIFYNRVLDFSGELNITPEHSQPVVEFHSKVNDCTNLKFIDYDNTVFVLGGTKGDEPNRDIFKLGLGKATSSNIPNVFSELPDDCTNSFAHIYNNKLYLVYQPTSDSYTILPYDIGLLCSNGYIAVNTGDGEEKHLLINHKDFKVNKNIYSIKYYDYNFNEQDVEAYIYKDDKWKLINT